MDALDKKEKLLVICGPTATGKTSLSVELAQRFNGEIISADSMQIYKGLDIGTAKVTTAEMQDVPHHLIDIIEPHVSYSVADYISAATEAIQDVTSKNKLPILCGGTGLYISSLVNGIDFSPAKIDTVLREKLLKELELLGTQEMYARLQSIDPTYAETLHPNNTTRVLRALELFEQTGVKMSDQIAYSKKAEKPYHTLILFLTYQNRALLYEKINIRIDKMMDEGLLEEAKFVYNHKEIFTTAAKAIGYKEFFPYFDKEQPLDFCIDKLKQATRNYAKRQSTWFQAIPNTITIYVDEQDCLHEGIKYAQQFMK